MRPIHSRNVEKQIASDAKPLPRRTYTLSTPLWKQERSQLTEGPGQGRPETSWRPGLANNLAPIKTDILFNLGQGWRNFLRARAETANNFRRNSFAYGNMSLLAPYCRLFQWRGCPVWSALYSGPEPSRSNTARSYVLTTEASDSWETYLSALLEYSKPTPRIPHIFCVRILSVKLYNGNIW